MTYNGHANHATFDAYTHLINDPYYLERAEEVVALVDPDDNLSPDAPESTEWVVDELRALVEEAFEETGTDLEDVGHVVWKDLIDSLLG